MLGTNQGEMVPAGGFLEAPGELLCADPEGRQRSQWHSLCVPVSVPPALPQLPSVNW